MLDLDRRGIPGVMLATTAFEEGARAQGELLSFEPAVVYTPHPIQNRTDEEMRAYADQAFETIMEMVGE